MRGSANGRAQLTFPRLDYKAATGKIDATFDAAVAPPEKEGEGAPAKGEISCLRRAAGSTSSARTSARSRAIDRDRRDWVGQRRIFER